MRRAQQKFFARPTRTAARLTGTVFGFIGTISRLTGTVSALAGTVSHLTGTISRGIETISGGAGTISRHTGTISGGVGTISGDTGTSSRAVGNTSRATGTVSRGTGTSARADGTNPLAVEHAQFSAGAARSAPKTPTRPLRITRRRLGKSPRRVGTGSHIHVRTTRGSGWPLVNRVCRITEGHPLPRVVLTFIVALDVSESAFVKDKMR